MENPIQKPWNAFPAWRLPDGMMKAAENQLECASEACENWEWGCACLVAAAVAAEFVIAWIHPSYSSSLERWGSAWADLAVLFGILGEVFFSRRDSKIQTELRKRSNDKLGAAEERAAKLEIEAAEIKRIVSWRQLTREQHEQIATMLRNLAPSIDLLVEYERGNAEAWSYARDFMTVFQEAGVKKVRECPNPMFGPAWGVRLVIAPEMDRKPFADAFNDAGVPVALFQADLSTHLPRNERAPNVYIFVAPKPPPA